ncbi:GspH/FimT family pseudopilin [Aestuariirhabdus sp. Z084]|uniref:GspH/FimT family pseudopilin n=1 Tax=Aestuariirhabdus haliotis TaxID=2918751 RepID=UPI00201B3775|nr:GspH/FimT family pseudopilin [Aestuariirhabdus haliotis]MCL6416187.1 GspH/FimT family pseudopilin [Aestuariirhabdus haliotis]MCL6420239.1 GspH/FimT family pseudopilin [Aestuariirhabdus haliotis]
MNSSNIQFKAQQRGFNLVEVMVTITVLAILVTLAAPSYTTFIADQQIKATSKEIVRNIQYARSEAVSRNAVITMGRTPGSANKAWEGGWQIYVDATPTGNSAFAAATDTMLRTVVRQAEGVTLSADNNANNWVSFRRDGRLLETAGINNVVFAVCDGRGTDSGRAITINSIGRAQITDNPASCNP